MFDVIEFGIRNLPDGGESGIAAVNAVERRGSVSVNGLVNRNSLWVSVDRVGRNHSGLVRILDDVVGDSHHRLVWLLRHLCLIWWRVLLHLVIKTLCRGE